LTTPTADDLSVDDACRLFRRITEHHVAPAPGQPGGIRISSAAFAASSDGSGVSISIEDTMLELGIEPHDLVAAHPGLLLAFITAGIARSEQKGIAREPTPEDAAHGNLTGLDTTGIRKRLARAADWEIGPVGA
jgi:hypothetical protein